MTHTQWAGSVSYHYQISGHEVSRQSIDQANRAGGLQLTMQAFGSHPDNERANHPAAGLSWYEMARFVNWLNTREGFPPAYKFEHQPGEEGYSPDAPNLIWDLGDPGFEPTNRFRNKYARYVLPGFDEWYKAAFYSRSGDTYYDFATGGGSDVPPIPTHAATSLTTYAIYGTQPRPVEVPPPPTPVDDAGGTSAYGAMGMSGNVSETLEDSFPPGRSFNTDPTAMRTSVGGHALLNEFAISSGNVESVMPGAGAPLQGFRVVAVEPAPRVVGGTVVFENNFDLPYPEQSSVSIDPNWSSSHRYADTGGNPGACLRIHPTFTGGFDLSQGGLLPSTAFKEGRTGMTWRPSTDGAIALVKFEFDVKAPECGPQLGQPNGFDDWPAAAYIEPMIYGPHPTESRLVDIDISAAQDWTHIEVTIAPGRVPQVDFAGEDELSFGFRVYTQPSQHLEMHEEGFDWYVSDPDTVPVYIDNFSVELKLADELPISSRSTTTFTGPKSGVLTVRTRAGRKYALRSSSGLEAGTSVPVGEPREGDGGIFYFPFDGGSAGGDHGFFWVEESE